MMAYRLYLTQVSAGADISGLATPLSKLHLLLGAPTAPALTATYSSKTTVSYHLHSRPTRPLIIYSALLSWSPSCVLPWRHRGAWYRGSQSHSMVNFATEGPNILAENATWRPLGAFGHEWGLRGAAWVDSHVFSEQLDFVDLNITR